MKYLLAFFLLLFLFESKAQNANSLFWKIDKEGYKTSYIFGSFMPVSCSSFAKKIGSLAPILDSVESVVFEYNYGNPVFNARVFKKYLNPKFEDYNKVFSKKQFRKLNRFTVRLGRRTFYEYDELDPIFAINMFRPSNQNLRCQFNIEYWILCQAKAKELEIRAIKDFEDWAQNYSRFKESNLNISYEALLAAKKNVRENKDSFQKIHDSYLNQEIDKLTDTEKHMEQDNPELYEYNWIPSITGILSKENSLFIFNVSHLGGENGLLEKLEQAGYKLEPVYLNRD